MSRMYVIWEQVFLYLVDNADFIIVCQGYASFPGRA